jgi:hypothetical protein
VQKVGIGGTRRGGGGGTSLHGIKRGLRWSHISFHMHRCDGLGLLESKSVYYEEKGGDMVKYITALTIPFNEGGLNNVCGK